jgi:MarR family transcriptional regulator, organic hydroperoxide resistance regulator
MLTTQIMRVLESYPAIYLACHRRHVRDDAEGTVVSQHQASVLDHLHPNRPTTLSDLAAHMGVGRSTMSITVARLVGRGYVKSRRNDEDGRRVDLTLTARGVEIAQSNTVLDPHLLGELIRLIPRSEAEAAIAGIECLARYARGLTVRRSRGARR